MNKKSIILLSSGLDSVVCLAEAKEKYNIKLALTFDYGQRAKDEEISSSKLIAKYYGIEHKIIKLDMLNEISNSALNGKSKIPQLNEKKLDDINITDKTAKAVWVPNRNGLFINIAAAIADAEKYSYIIIGANKEEGATFKDNSQKFIDAINNSLKYSALNNVQVYAPLINLNKTEIVKKGIELNIPFDKIYSCYTGEKKHCGKCESCLRLKKALQLNNKYDIIKEIF